MTITDQMSQRLRRVEPVVLPEGVVCLDAHGQRLKFDWGQPHQLGTAAFWVTQTRERSPSLDHRIGERTLAEEVVACLLGGYGLPARIGLAAFRAVRAAGLIATDPAPNRAALEGVLSRPLLLDSGRSPVRYRFPVQRAARVACALQQLSEHEVPEDPWELRDWLVGVPGIGPKTASWVVRNWHGTDGIAIIDVHVRRAGLAAGFFLPSWRLPRDYALFEAAFSHVAAIGGVSTAALDARIWRDLSFLGRAGSLLVGPDAGSRDTLSS
jgi:N-glycosylase/DNA lyase